MYSLQKVQSDIANLCTSIEFMQPHVISRRHAGKYTKDGKKPGGPRFAIFSDEKLDKIAPLISLMSDIGSGHGGKSPTQVAINWVMCKGAIPIVGALLPLHYVLPHLRPQLWLADWVQSKERKKRKVYLVRRHDGSPQTWGSAGLLS